MTNTELIGRIAAALIKGELYERVSSVHITKTCPCNMQQFLKVKKMMIFR